MKFLGKTDKSEIYTSGKTYVMNGDNSILREMLLAEQKNFCAYSEKYIDDLDTVEIEHFNPDKKGNDDYYNYYAALRSCNAHNKRVYPDFKGSTFFISLFFQNNEELAQRLEYRDGQYQETDETDFEMIGLIEFLGFNRQQLYNDRKKHIKLLKSTFEDGNYTKEQQLNYFRNNPQQLDFITAIEIELELDLSEFYN